MPLKSKLLFLNDNLKTQCGQALLALLVLLTISAGAAFYTLVRPASSTIERDKITADALAQAKVALIGYAAGVSDLTGGDRPGDLPCPDLNDSGFTGTSCGNAAGTTGQTSRIGRLPWKSLGLPDLRDGDGERLWYAVSNKFKFNIRTICILPGQPGYFVGAEVDCLNSDTRGTITIRDSAGTVINNGANPDPFTPSGVIAVIFAPGTVLTGQNRSCTGGSCTAAGVCNSSPTTLTPKCNPINYLDILTGIEGNSDFVDGSATNGFINGVIRNAAGNVVVNDRLLTITYNDLMPVLQRRVAKEVLNCLTQYAAIPQNNGRYPWAAPVTDVTPPYTDQVNTRFGRVPDIDTASSTYLAATFLGVGGAVATAVCTNILFPSPLCMAREWPPSCGIRQGTWWTNWKEMVFYGVADAYKPADPISGILGVPAPGGCGSCLRVDPPSSASDKRVIVAVAGKRLSSAAYVAGNGQPRATASDKQDPTNYLEGENNNPPVASIYEQQPISASFSDFLLYQ